MTTKVKAIITVVGVLLVIAAISLIIISRGPLYGENSNDNWVPDLIGEWIGEVIGYAYGDATEWPMETPEYYEGPLSNDGNIFITHQTGQVFAGTFEEGGGIFSGVILMDRTVTIQFFELSEFRLFFTGRMTKSGDTLQMSGYVHAFDDLQPEGNTEMGSGYVRLFKVN